MWKQVGWKKRAPPWILTRRQGPSRWKRENLMDNVGSRDKFWSQTLAVYVHGNLKLFNVPGGKLVLNNISSRDGPEKSTETQHEMQECRR